jgi:hypothetical protein
MMPLISRLSFFWLFAMMPHLPIEPNVETQRKEWDIWSRLRQKNADALFIQALRAKENASLPSSSVASSTSAPILLGAQIGIAANGITSRSVPNQTQGNFEDGAKDMLECRKRKSSELAMSREIDPGEIVHNHNTHEPVKEVIYMRHRLRKNLDFFKTFVQSTIVLSWISEGFPLRWTSGFPPPPKRFTNHKSAYEYSEFVTASIKNLVAAGSAMKVNFTPHVVLPLGVVLQKGKKRLILDGRYINSHVIIPSFKYEDLGCCHEYIKPDDFLITYDLSKGYHHMDIHEDFFTYLGFEWEGQSYVYTCLPFGLAPACWAFTKLTRECLSKWRKVGHRCSGYIDDSMHANQSSEALTKFAKEVIEPDFAACGFVVNEEKSDNIPTQKNKYLGMFVDTVRRWLEVPSERRESLISLIQKVLRYRYHCSVNVLSVIAGNLSSMHWAFGNLARLMTMNIYAEITKAPHRNAFVILSDITIQDLNFWLVGFDRYNGYQPIWQPVGFHMTIYTDAAGLNLSNYGGWAGWTKGHNTAIKVARGIFTESDHQLWAEYDADHSTYQELYAIHQVILSFNTKGELSGKRLLIKTDNQGVFSIINRGGSHHQYVHELCKALIWYCIHHHIGLHANWIPREKNTLADFYSKLSDSSDWKLRPAVFERLQDSFGKFEIDIFSSLENRQTRRFYSLYCQPECTGVDAFSFPWGRRCWCNPPFHQMARVLAHARSCEARMCLICPFTPTAPWWHALLADDYFFFASFVLECIELGGGADLFLSGRHSYKYMGRKPRWFSIALLVDFAPSCIADAPTVRIPVV